MKQRILTGWTLQRGIYVVLGVFVIAQSVSRQDWLSTAFGTYFASMGVFAFGCAGGNCYGGNCATEPNTNKNVEKIPE